MKEASIASYAPVKIEPHEDEEGIHVSQVMQQNAVSHGDATKRFLFDFKFIISPKDEELPLK